MTAEEHRARQADRLKAIRLRMAIWRVQVPDHTQLVS
jgi:hypothetical protein